MRSSLCTPRRGPQTGTRGFPWGCKLTSALVVLALLRFLSTASSTPVRLPRCEFWECTVLSTLASYKRPCSGLVRYEQEENTRVTWETRCGGSGFCRHCTLRRNAYLPSRALPSWRLPRRFKCICAHVHVSTTQRRVGKPRWAAQRCTRSHR